MAPVLGYWDIRGLGEPIRYLLHYCDHKFVDKRYFTYPSWQNDKFHLNLNFPNLPYLIDGNVRLTQSTAILRYFARKLNMEGSTEVERVRIAIAEQQIVDLRSNLMRICYSSEHERLKPDLEAAIPAQMKLWSDFLGDRDFLAGDNITYVDFMAYDTFDFYELFQPTALKEYPSLKAYIKRIANLPQLQIYLKSESYKRWPIFGPIANFGGRGEEPKRE